LVYTLDLLILMFHPCPGEGIIGQMASELPAAGQEWNLNQIVLLLQFTFQA
jgi:hypothetical protein